MWVGRVLKSSYSFMQMYGGTVTSCEGVCYVSPFAQCVCKFVLKCKFVCSEIQVCYVCLL